MNDERVDGGILKCIRKERLHSMISLYCVLSACSTNQFLSQLMRSKAAVHFVEGCYHVHSGKQGEEECEWKE